MRLFSISLLLALSFIQASFSFAADPDSTSTPSNQSDVKVEKSAPKAGVTSDQSQSAGVHTGSGSLDPSQQSSMGLGIQIPFTRTKEAPTADLKNADDAPKK